MGAQQLLLKKSRSQLVLEVHERLDGLAEEGPKVEVIEILENHLDDERELFLGAGGNIRSGASVETWCWLPK